MIDQSKYLSLTHIIEELPIFYQPWFLDLNGIEWDVWIDIQEDIYVIFPFFKEKKYMFTFSRPAAPFMPYYGPYFYSNKNQNISEEYIESAYAKILKALPSFSEIYLTPHYSFENNFLSRYGFESKAMTTHVIDLRQSEDELWSALDYMRKKNIKQAQQKLLLQENDFDVDLYFNWIQRTYKSRNEKLIHPKSLYLDMCSEIIEHDSAIYNTYYDTENRPIAMSFCMHDKHHAYSILGANNPDIKNNAATTALLWQAILKSQALGCSVFDFEGSNIEGVAQFFQKFGSQKISYNVWHKTNSLLWSIKKKLF